jgi:hypothetical protein
MLAAPNISLPRILQGAALTQEKAQWLEKLRAVEAGAEQCRSEARQLRVRHLAMPGRPLPADRPLGSAEGQERDALVQLVLEAQAGEAALRGVLAEEREEQVAACKALAAELRRVHALERLRAGEQMQGAMARMTSWRAEAVQSHHALPPARAPAC